ncbi:MAG: hypothetical protein PHF63_03220, partial [Herbinix sp.]|nr:hypothetical protein [Herbinix sp.]
KDIQDMLSDEPYLEEEQDLLIHNENEAEKELEELTPHEEATGLEESIGLEKSTGLEEQIILEEEDLEDSFDDVDKTLSRIEKEFQINMDEIFGEFLQVVSIKHQLVKSLESILQENTQSVLMVITGTKGEEITKLAKAMALFMSKIGKLKSSKVAKITAEKLNSVDIKAKTDTLRNCCLIVENARDLKCATIDNLLKLTGNLLGDIAVILEDNEKNMNKLLKENPKLMDLLKNRIHLRR